MHYIKNNDKEFLTVYSLGNFVSNQRDFRKDGGVMFRCSIVKRDKASISDKEYILTWVNKFYKNEKWHYEVLPCSNKTYGKNTFLETKTTLRCKYIQTTRKTYLQIIILIFRRISLPKIHLQKHEPQELRNQKNTKWIKKLNLFKYRKNKNAK